LCLRNILIDKQGQPYLIDFESSYCKADSKLSRWFFKKMQREDLYHLYKLKMKLRPGLMTEEEVYIATHSSYLRTIYRLVYFEPCKIIRGVIRSMLQGHRRKRRFRRGILWLPFTFPAWTEVYGGLSRAITRRGSLLSSGACVFCHDNAAGGGGSTDKGNRAAPASKINSAFREGLSLKTLKSVTLEDIERGRGFRIGYVTILTVFTVGPALDTDRGKLL